MEKLTEIRKSVVNSIVAGDYETYAKNIEKLAKEEAKYMKYSCCLSTCNKSNPYPVAFMKDSLDDLLKTLETEYKLVISKDDMIDKMDDNLSDEEKKEYKEDLANGGFMATTIDIAKHYPEHKFCSYMSSSKTQCHLSINMDFPESFEEEFGIKK